MKMKMKVAVLIVLTGFFVLSPTRALAATASDVASQLICQCGCTAVLNNCNHGECMIRDSMTALIEENLDEGQSTEQIITFFVSQYGEQVLSSPPKKGFNLMAWLLPFAAIVAGGVGFYLLMKKWVLRGRETEASSNITGLQEPDRYWEQVEKELADFSERSFR